MRRIYFRSGLVLPQHIDSGFMHARVRVRLSSAGASVSATVDEDTPPPDPGPSMRKSCIYRFYKIYYTIDAGGGRGVVGASDAWHARAHRLLHMGHITCSVLACNVLARMLPRFHVARCCFASN